MQSKVVGLYKFGCQYTSYDSKEGCGRSIDESSSQHKFKIINMVLVCCSLVLQMVALWRYTCINKCERERECLAPSCNYCWLIKCQDQVNQVQRSYQWLNETRSCLVNVQSYNYYIFLNLGLDSLHIVIMWATLNYIRSVSHHIKCNHFCVQGHL